MRIVLSGGGTAGHINPALAIAGYLQKQEQDTEILYIGAKSGMEERLVEKAGLPFAGITISGFRRKISLGNFARNVRTVVRMFTSSREAKKLLLAFKPDVVIGTGGYVSGPVLREASKLGIPTLIHESNAYPGITNKALSKHATYTLLAVEDAKKYMDENANCVVVGNPVRQAVLEADPAKARKALGLDVRPVILSFGGSLGARAMNEAVADVMAATAKEQLVQHIHAYGEHGRWMPHLLEEKGVHLADNPQIHISEYLYNMPDCLAAADLVICRAGAMTLSELEATGTPAILVPSPNVAENHQYHNAMALVSRGGALLLEEKDLTGRRLTSMVEELLQSPQKLVEMGQHAKEMAILDTNLRIYQLVRQLVQERR